VPNYTATFGQRVYLHYINKWIAIGMLLRLQSAYWEVVLLYTEMQSAREQIIFTDGAAFKIDRKYN
jgi:hypothetical protein